MHESKRAFGGAVPSDTYGVARKPAPAARSADQSERTAGLSGQAENDLIFAKRVYIR